MLVATFGPSTAWTGRKIVFENELITLEAHGVISAQAVVDYDRAGNLTWPSAEMREWVVARARGEAQAEAKAAKWWTDEGVHFGKGRYIGGYPPLGHPHEGIFKVTRQAVGIVRHKGVPLSQVSCFDVGGGQIAKSRAGYVLAFGVLGLAAKGSTDRAEVVVHTIDGEMAAFEVFNIRTVQVRAGLAPWLRSFGVPFADELAAQRMQQAEVPVPSATAELERLAALHASGALSDEEFVAFKARLIGA
jgi:hypothetical protein